MTETDGDIVLRILRNVGDKNQKRTFKKVNRRLLNKHNLTSHQGRFCFNLRWIIKKDKYR